MQLPIHKNSQRYCWSKTIVMKLLIVYGTTEGQTRKICRFIKDETEKYGCQVDLFNAIDEPLFPTDYDKVIIAGSIHVGGYQTAVKHYVKEHHLELSKKPSAFISVSLTAAGDDAESWKELNEITHKFLEETNWNPSDIVHAAGALKYSKYDFFKKMIMRMIAKQQGGGTDTSEDYEYTDWKR